MPFRGDWGINNVALVYNNFKTYSTSSNKIIVTPASFFSTGNTNFYINNNVATFTSLNVDNTGNMFTSHWDSNSGFITKYNNANQVYCQEIDASIAGNGNSFAYMANMEVVVPYNNNVYIGGRILNANIAAGNFSTPNGYNVTNSYPLLAKLDANSNSVVWAKFLYPNTRVSFQNGWGTILKIVIDTADGSIYALTDTAYGEGTNSSPSNINLGATLVKFDDTGNLQWQKTIFYCVPNDLKIFNNGDLLVIGTGKPPGVTYPIDGIQTFYAGRFYGSNGNPIWQRYLKDTTENKHYRGYAGDITSDQQYYYIAGYKSNRTASLTTNSGTILKMPANGQIIGNGIYTLPNGWGQIQYYNAASSSNVTDPGYTPYDATLTFTANAANYGSTTGNITVDTGTSFRIFYKI